MKTPDQWDRGYAETLAAHYAGEQSRLNAEVSANKKLGEALRQYLDLNDLEALVDGETGCGVELGRAASDTKYDTTSMPDELVISLARRGLLQVHVPSFNALRKAGGGVDLDETETHFKLPGERARPLKVVVK